MPLLKGEREIQSGYRIIIHLFLFILTAFCFFLPSPARCNTYSEEITRASSDVRAARNRLLMLPVHDLETKISRRAASSISQMKEAMEKLVITYLGGISVDSVPDVRKIEDDLSNLIGSRRPPPGGTVLADPESNRFGYEAWFEAKITPDERQLLQIKSTHLQHTVRRAFDASHVRTGPKRKSLEGNSQLEKSAV